MQGTLSVVLIVALAQLLIRSRGLKPIEAPASLGGGRWAMCTLLRRKERVVKVDAGGRAGGTRTPLRARTIQTYIGCASVSTPGRVTPPTLSISLSLARALSLSCFLSRFVSLSLSLSLFLSLSLSPLCPLTSRTSRCAAEASNDSRVTPDPASTGRSRAAAGSALLSDRLHRQAPSSVCHAARRRRVEEGTRAHAGV